FQEFVAADALASLLRDRLTARGRACGAAEDRGALLQEFALPLVRRQQRIHFPAQRLVPRTNAIEVRTSLRRITKIQRCDKKVVDVHGAPRAIAQAPLHRYREISSPKRIRKS